MLAFILRNWQAFAGLAVAAILFTMLMIRTDQRDDARLAHERSEQAGILFAERVRSKAEEIGRRFTANARRIETEQTQITQEVSREYQDRISELHRRVAALRLLPQGGGADPGGAGGPSVPGLPDSSRGPDAAPVDRGLPLPVAVIATEQAIRLEELQRWIRRQAEADRASPAE